MEKIRIVESSQLTWDYDEGADVLYISLREPSEAVGVDIGEGVVVRFDEPKGEVVGLTVIGVKQRIVEHLRR